MLTSASLKILFLFVLVQGNGEQDALFIDRFHNSLFYLPTENYYNDKMVALAVACPAESVAENDFVRRYSITRSSLFVKEIYQNDIKMSEVGRNSCKELSRVSLAYNVKTSYFEIGFEIYYGFRDAEYFHHADYDDYKSPKKVAKVMESLSSVKNIDITLKNGLDDRITEALLLDDDRKMRFTWINLAKIKFDFSNKILKYIVYDMDLNSRWPVRGEVCEDYHLGSEIYGGNNIIDDLYKQQSFEFPYRLPSDAKCSSNSDCFKKWSVIPMDRFRYGSSKHLCSNITTIPIWKTDSALEFILKKLDQYLYAFVQGHSRQLYIITGVGDESHKFHKKGSWFRLPFMKITMYLDPETKIIPIPKIIYKIVEYRVNNYKRLSEDDDEEYCWFSVVVIIHNDPFFKSGDRLCSKKYTEQLGWQEITKISKKKTAEFIYVCPKNKNTMGKLFGLNSRNIHIISGTFDLKNFSPISGNIIQRTAEQFRKLENNGNDEELKRGNFPLSQHHDNPENNKLFSQVAV